MKTLLIDGQWNLKRNFYKRKSYVAKGEMCGGSFGFLDSIRGVINRILPDRVVVMWDGLYSGKLRYEIYRPYKAKRKKNWDKEYTTIVNEVGNTEEEQEKLELLKQKLVINEFLDLLGVRHLEVKYIEADDLIAYYILSSKIPNEEIVIYSRDDDYVQLVSETVSILNPDKLTLITVENFKNEFGFTHQNALLLKCFKGDKSDGIEGVKGVTVKKILEYFPNVINERYTYNRLVEESYDKKREKKIKFFDKIIDAREVLYRNAKLINLKKPFINDEVKEEMLKIVYNALENNLSIQGAIYLFFRKGFNKFVLNENTDIFFSSFYRIVMKEKEFNKF